MSETLSNYIKEINSGIVERYKDSDNDPPLIEEDINHWKDLGVHTAKDIDKYMFCTTLFELSNDLNKGYSWQDLISLNEEELQSKFEILVNELKTKIKQHEKNPTDN